MQTTIEIIEDALAKVNEDGQEGGEAKRTLTELLKVLRNPAPHYQNEWARIPAACKISGVCRSTLYANFDFRGGRIKTASLKRKGINRGIRMVSIPSLLAWIDSYAEQDQVCH